MTNIGVARYDLSSDTWLSLWDEDNLLNSNEITSIEKDLNPNNLWVGGGDGLQLINTTTESEILHWPEGSSQYPGGRNPYQITIINDVLHYRYQWQFFGSNWGEDQIRRIDLTSSSTLPNLDAGQRLGVNGYTWGMGQSGDYLNIGVSEYSQGAILLMEALLNGTLLQIHGHQILNLLPLSTMLSQLKQAKENIG